MSQKPENRMLSRLKPRLENEELFVEKTNNPYRSGIPDWYLECESPYYPDTCGWIEAKFRNVKGPNADPAYEMSMIRSQLSPHQDRWLKRAARNGVPAAILCGYQDTKTFAFFAYDASPLEGSFIYHKDTIIQVIHSWLTGSQ